MTKLQHIIPDADALIQLEPEELGGLLLQVLMSREKPLSQFHPGTSEGELFGSPRETAYPREKQEAVLAAIREAFAWLAGQTLIVATDPLNTNSGWRVVSRRGRRLAAPDISSAVARGERGRVRLPG